MNESDLYHGRYQQILHVQRLRREGGGEQNEEKGAPRLFS
jgi:hypothetical protein